jgi:ADP-dependent NAD(P)H-hydrate dehydratase
MPRSPSSRRPPNERAGERPAERPAGRRPTAVTSAALRRWPLPVPEAGGDKGARGTVLVVGGALELPGAVVLAGVAALRAGAGKLQMATCESIASAVGIAVPEALVVRLAETKDGGIAPDAASRLAERLEKCDAVLVGPGMVGEDDVVRFVAVLLTALGALGADAPVLVLDAAALGFVAKRRDTLLAYARAGGRVVLTPHAGEMAGALGIDKSEVEADPAGVARRAAGETGAAVALKGPTTFIAEPGGGFWKYDAGDVGLATSGSGDTLAGVVAGLAARGAGPAQAAAWGVFLHGAAGNRLRRRIGRVGFLARELLDEVPRAMDALGGG